MQVQRLSPVLGARVLDVDLSRGNYAQVWPLIEKVIHTHGVVFLPDQNLTPYELRELAQFTGTIHMHPHMRGLDDCPEVMEIIKSAADTRNFGGEWHTDQMFLPEPAKLTMLQAVELPEVGGDTLFACMRGALTTLSVGMQRMVRTLRTINLPDAGRRRAGNEGAYQGFGSMPGQTNDAREAEVEHPLVRTHPDTGEEVLYLGLHTERFADMTREESQPLLDYLMQWLTRDENKLRFNWTPGILAIWDNRRVLHNAMNDYPGERRRMFRATTTGTRPFLTEA
jgi:taurine dioxygenase